MEYEKPWLSYEQQADLLIDERGLIANRENLIRHLQEVGYYRLSGYWYIFKRSNVSDFKDIHDERFIAGTTFDEIWGLYTFDRQLRLLTLDAIERIEVYFRSQLAYELAKETGPFGYLEPENLPRLDEEEYCEFLERCETQYLRSSEPFVRTSRRSMAIAKSCLRIGLWLISWNSGRCCASIKVRHRKFEMNSQASSV